MGEESRSARLMVMALLVLLAGVASCDMAANPGVGENQVDAATRWSYQDWPTGPYRVV
jgi:hypothetical protein